MSKNTQAYQEYQVNCKVPNNLSLWLEQWSYEKLSDIFREDFDAHSGIISHRQGGYWIRDARNAKKPVNSDIKTTKLMLHCLSRVRAIDHCLATKFPNTKGAKLQAELREEFIQLIEHVHIIKQKVLNIKREAYLEPLEAQFNAKLIQLLHKANLTADCKTKKHAQALLKHYDGLSTLLEDELTVVTFSNASNNGDIIYKETLYPITDKTQDQKEKLKIYQDIILSPTKAERNQHSCAPLAHQEANCLFYTHMRNDQRTSSVSHHGQGVIAKLELLELKVNHKGELEDIKHEPLDQLLQGVDLEPHYLGIITAPNAQQSADFLQPLEDKIRALDVDVPLYIHAEDKPFARAMYQKIYAEQFRLEDVTQDNPADKFLLSYDGEVFYVTYNDDNLAEFSLKDIFASLGNFSHRKSRGQYLLRHGQFDVFFKEFCDLYLPIVCEKLALTPHKISSCTAYKSETLPPVNLDKKTLPVLMSPYLPRTIKNIRNIVNSELKKNVNDLCHFPEDAQDNPEILSGMRLFNINLMPYTGNIPLNSKGLNKVLQTAPLKAKKEFKQLIQAFDNTITQYRFQNPQQHEFYQSAKKVLKDIKKYERGVKPQFNKINQMLRHCIALMDTKTPKERAEFHAARLNAIATPIGYKKINKIFVLKMSMIAFVSAALVAIAVVTAPILAIGATAMLGVGSATIFSIAIGGTFFHINQRKKLKGSIENLTDSFANNFPRNPGGIH